jgi:SAM-dependent methyltransferase
MGRERLEPEFGRYATWLADAIHELDLADAVPAACRGTANPNLFERVAIAIESRPGARVIDVGCGSGGPGAWLERTHRCEVVGVDVMKEGVRSVARLFPKLKVVAATTRRLPFRNESFDAAWALGVLETIDDKRGALKEVARVLRPGGRFGIYSFVSTGAGVVDAPAADRFEPAVQIVDWMAGAGFSVLDASPALFDPAPQAWKDVQRSVRARVGQRHAGDSVLELVDAERSKISRLWAEEQIQPWLFVLSKEA